MNDVLNILKEKFGDKYNYNEIETKSMLVLDVKEYRAIKVGEMIDILKTLGDKFKYDSVRVGFGDNGGSYYGDANANYIHKEEDIVVIDSYLDEDIIVNNRSFIDTLIEYNANNDLYIKNMDDGGDYGDLRYCEMITIDFSRNVIIFD